MSWEQVWGPTDFVVVDGETGAVYAKPAAAAKLPDDLYQWTGDPGVWTPLQTPAKSVRTFAAAGWKPGNALYYLASSGEVYRYNGVPGSWTGIGGPSGGKAGDLFGGPDQLLATATDSSQDIFRWNDLTESWVKIGGPGKTFVVGKSSDVEFKLQVYGLSLDNAPAKQRGIYQWSGSWYQRGGPAGAVFVSQSRLFATNPVSGDLMSLYPTGWKRIGGPGKTFATDQRCHIYGLSNDSDPQADKGVYSWEGTPNKWKRIGGPASKLFAGWDGLVFATNPDTGELWRYAGEAPDFGTLPNFAGKLVTEKMKNVSGKRQLVAVLWDPKRPAHPAPPKADIEKLLFGARPSVADWFQENSGGRCQVVKAAVAGWFDAPASKQGEHYWDNPNSGSADPAVRDPHYHQKKYNDGWLDGHGEKWADAITEAAASLKLPAYDTNKDKSLTVDELGFLVVIPQKESFGTVRGVSGKQYPKRVPLILQGMTIPVTAEWYLGDPPDFGTAIHELAHLLLGTPDMYFIGHWPYAAGRYSVSDQDGPIHLSAPEKLKLGWLNYKVATASGNFSLKDVETQNEALILYNPKRGSDEYFLIENRWRGTSYDVGGAKIGAGIPMDGIAIWHVIENPAVFDTVSPFPPTGVKGEWGRLGIRLIRANGGLSFNDSAALFAKKNQVISDHTSPANLCWLDGKPSGFRVKLLTDAAATVQLTILVTAP